MASNDIDGLLESIESTGVAAAAANDSELKLDHYEGKKDKKEKKKKKERKVEDMEMGQVSYTPEIAGSSTYQAGLQSSGFGAGDATYGGAPNQTTSSMGASGSTYGGAAHSGYSGGGSYDANSHPPIPRREFSLCGPGTQDLLINLCLLLAFCAFEAVFSMMAYSNLLMLDFYRRLGGVFAMVYTLEVVQASVDTEVVDGRTVMCSALPDINTSTTAAERLQKVDRAALDLRGTDRRRLYLASLMIGVYLLGVAFVCAMAAIVSMYGGAPPTVEKSGWIMVIGCLCLVLDLVHVRYNVQVNLGTAAEDESNTWSKILGASYGSLFLIFEATLMMTVGGGYVDPILVLLFSAAVAAASSDSVMRNATAMLYQSWSERSF